MLNNNLLPDKSKEAYTVIEIAQMASSSRSAIYIEIKAGRLKASKIGRRTVILKKNFDSWLDSLEQIYHV